LNDELLSEIASGSGLTEHEKSQIYYALNPEKLGSNYKLYNTEFSFGGPTTMAGIRIDLLLKRDGKLVIGEIKTSADNTVREQIMDYKYELEEFLSFYSIDLDVETLLIYPEDALISPSLQKSNIKMFNYNKSKILKIVNSVYDDIFTRTSIKRLKDLNNEYKNKTGSFSKAGELD